MQDGDGDWSQWRASATGAIGVVAVGDDPNADNLFDGVSGLVTVEGVDAGDGLLTVVGVGDAPATFPISTATVGGTTLVVTSDEDPDVADLTSPVHVFTNSIVPVAQTNVDSNGKPLLGEAPLMVIQGATSVHYDPSSLGFAAGATPGTAHLVGLRADLELDVVGSDAIAAFTINGYAPMTPIPLQQGTGNAVLYLLPYDASGHLLVGPGTDPIVLLDGVAQPTSDTSIVRSMLVNTHWPGSVPLEVSWGNVTEQFTIVTSTF